MEKSRFFPVMRTHPRKKEKKQKSKKSKKLKAEVLGQMAKGKRRKAKDIGPKTASGKAP